MGNQHGESAWVRPNQHGRLSRDGRDGRDGRVVGTLFLADVKVVEHVIVSNACPAVTVSAGRGQLLQLGIGKE